MKKVLIGILMLIPLLVIGSVVLASKIVSVEAYIGVDSVELSNSYVEFDGISTEPYELVAKVYPTMAKNKGIEWYIEESSVIKFDSRFDGTPCEVIDGKVYVYTYCAFTVVARSVEGVKSARCDFYVAGNTIENISIENSLVNLSTGEKASFDVTLSPINAIVKDTIVWSSSNSEVATVDGNGIITAVAAGTAMITASYNNESRIISDIAEVIVSEGAFKFNEVYITGDTLQVSSVSDGDCTAVSGCSIAGGVITVTGDTAVIERQGKQLVIKRLSEGSIVFENYNMLNGSNVIVGKTKLRLKAVLADSFSSTDLTGIVYTSSDETVASIDSAGVVTAFKSGDVTFTAEYGGKVAVINIVSAKPVTYFRLTTNNETDKKGIAQTTVYGATSFVGTSYNTVREKQFEISYPSDVGNDEFIWGSSNPSVAYFDENIAGLLHYAEGLSGEYIITITVTAVYPTYSTLNVQETYTYTLIGDGINCVTYHQLSIAANSLQKVTVLHSNVVISDEPINVSVADGAYTISDRLYLHDDFYGNGYRLERLDTANFNNSYKIIEVKYSNIKISNVNLRLDVPAYTISELNQEGECIHFEPADYNNRLQNIILEYSIIEYCKFGVASYHSDAYINGCIFRNTSNISLYMPMHNINIGGVETNSFNNITINNCIFGLCPTPCIGLSNFSPNVDNGHSTLTITGFIEMYNWQKISELNLMQNMTGNPTTDNAIRYGIQGLLESDTVEPYRYNYNGEDYFCLGIFVPGALSPSIGKVIEDGTNDLTYAALELGIVHTIYFYTYGKNAILTPGSTYQDNVELYARLRGEA